MILPFQRQKMANSIEDILEDNNQIERYYSFHANGINECTWTFNVRGLYIKRTCAVNIDAMIEEGCSAAAVHKQILE